MQGQEGSDELDTLIVGTGIFGSIDQIHHMFHSTRIVIVSMLVTIKEEIGRRGKKLGMIRIAGELNLNRG
jgi:hypothetical protein